MITTCAENFQRHGANQERSKRVVISNMLHGAYGFYLRTEYQGNKHHRYKCFVCIFVERGYFLYFQLVYGNS